MTSTSETLRAAEASIQAGSKSFAAASRLFDRTTRDGVVMLYAWCRHLDDVVDGQHLGFADLAGGGSADVAARLDILETQTRDALAGSRPSHPAFAALQAVVRRYDIPERYPLRHLEGFRMDVGKRRYATLADTLDYADGVAGVVGIMMAHVMGVRDEPTLGRARDLGLAFQLTNMARDIVEDARVGRVYMPAVWLRDAGIPETEVADPRHREKLARVASQLVEAAEPLYASASIGIEALPLRSAWAIATALGLYRAIGLEVRRRGARAWDERVSTSHAAKLWHVARGGKDAIMSRSRGTGV